MQPAPSLPATLLPARALGPVAYEAQQQRPVTPARARPPAEQSSCFASVLPGAAAFGSPLRRRCRPVRSAQQK